MPHADSAGAVYHLCLESAGHEGTLCSCLLSSQKVFEVCTPMTFRVTYHTTGLRSYSGCEDVEIDALAVRRWRKDFDPWSHDMGAIWLVGVCATHIMSMHVLSFPLPLALRYLPSWRVIGWSWASHELWGEKWEEIWSIWWHYKACSFIKTWWRHHQKSGLHLSHLVCELWIE